MRVLIQRVKRASVTVDGELISQIAQGLLVLVGICDEDNHEDIEWLTKKISNKLVKTLLDYGVDMAAEGAEEVISSFFSNLGGFFCLIWLSHYNHTFRGKSECLCSFCV